MLAEKNMFSFSAMSELTHNVTSKTYVGSNFVQTFSLVRNCMDISFFICTLLVHPDLHCSHIIAVVFYM